MKPLPIPGKNPDPCLGLGYSRVGVRVTPERPRGYLCPSWSHMSKRVNPSWKQVTDDTSFLFFVFALSPIIALVLANSCLIHPVKTSTLISASLHRSLESSLSLLQLHITADACRYAPVYASSERSAEERSRSLM